MSLSDLTRNCFQNGLSAQKWVGLCKLFIANELDNPATDSTVEVNISNSVLLLYHSYPADPNLQAYLKHAIARGLVSLPIYVSTMLQAARSPELHTPASLDPLCRIALEEHYSSGLPALGSLVAASEPPPSIATIVNDGLALLRTAYALPMSHSHHELTSSASQLIILLLSCLPDLSQVANTQAAVLLAEVTHLLQDPRLLGDVRTMLDSFRLSLGPVIGDDARSVREAQVMHTLQLALGKGDILGPSSDTDIVTFSLIFHRVVSYRAHDFGLGDTEGIVAVLVALFRWASWPPSVFYTQMYLAALTCLSQSKANALIWKSFIVCRLPRLIQSFETVINADGSTTSEWRQAIQAAMLVIQRRGDIIAQCDHAISNVVQVRPEAHVSFFRSLLQQLKLVGLLNFQYNIEFGTTNLNQVDQKLRSEAQEFGMDLEPYLETKLGPEAGDNDFHAWVDRVWRDVGSHHIFAKVVFRRFVSFAQTLDVESLGHLCRILYTYEPVLDILTINSKVSDLVAWALLVLEQYDCETVGDPQTAVSHLGDIVLFVQYIAARFHFENNVFLIDGHNLSTSFFTSTDIIYPVESLSPEDVLAFNTWFKALFDVSSEGIEDNILRTTQPKTLLRISATLFSQAVKSHLVQSIDSDVLNNGVSYFTSPLLSWTLVGVIKALSREIQQEGFSAPAQFDILQMLLSSPSCPRPVLALCGSRALFVLNNRKDKAPPTFNADAIRGLIAGAVNYKGPVESVSVAAQLSKSLSREEESRRLIQTAFADARAGKAPALDVEYCIRILPPSKFLRQLWSELTIAAKLGELENCRRLATFVLAIPRPLNTPPLLPIFIHVVSPLLMVLIDRQQQPEQRIYTELLATIISSVLTAALHLELALRANLGERRFVLGQPSAALARKFASDMQKRKDSPTSRAISERLASSQAFVANFPVFMS